MNTLRSQWSCRRAHAAGKATRGIILASFAAATVAAAAQVAATVSTAPANTEVLAAAAADALVAGRPPLLHSAADDAFARQPVVSSVGLQYVPYRRTYRGLPVYGGDFVVVTDRGGHVLSTSVAQTKVITVSTVPARGAAEAAATATAASRSTVVDSVAVPRLVVYALGTPRLAWETVVRGHTGVRPSAVHVFVDAVSGVVLDRYDEIADADDPSTAGDSSGGTHRGTSNGTGVRNGNGAIYGSVAIQTTGSGSAFSMADPTRPGTACADYSTTAVLTGDDDVWGNGDGSLIETGCVDALFSAEREWDMFRAWFGRNGIDGDGHGFPIQVGLDAPTAFWGGSYVAIGHNTAGRYIGAFDVVGHELGHALDSTTPGGSAGNGVREATGDIIGTALEFFARDPHDPPDFTIGEQVNILGDGPIRRMYNPALVGDPNCYSSAIPTMDVDQAAGPLDHWFTLVAKGSAARDGLPASPTCNGSTVIGLSTWTAARIFYNAMLSKTTAMSYLRYRTATLDAAKNLFPGNCGPFTTVKAAWDAINVPAQATDPTC